MRRGPHPVLGRPRRRMLPRCGAVVIASAVLATGALLGSPALGGHPVAAASSGQWSTTGSLAVARQGAAAVAITCPTPTVPAVPACGDVLVVGGMSKASGAPAPAPLGSAEWYGVAAKTWSTAPPLPQPMAAPVATLIPSSPPKVLVVDGDGTPVADLFDTSTGVWTPTTAMKSGHVGPVAAALSSDQVLVVGTAAASSVPGATPANAELYSVSAKTWTSVDSAPAVSGATATAYADPTTADPDVLVAGGASGGTPTQTAEIYDGKTGAWSGTGRLATPRFGHTATRLGDGRILVAGGVGAGPTALGSAEIFDPKTTAWTSTGSMAASRESTTATLLRDGTVLVAGGTGDGSSPLSSAEVYDPQAGTWTPTGSLNGARFAGTATPLTDGTVLAAGGCCSNGASLASAELYTITPAAPPTPTPLVLDNGSGTNDGPGDVPTVASAPDTGFAGAEGPAPGVPGTSGTTGAGRRTTPSQHGSPSGASGARVLAQVPPGPPSSPPTPAVPTAGPTPLSAGGAQPLPPPAPPDASAAGVPPLQAIRFLAVALALLSIVAWLGVRRSWWETARERVAGGVGHVRDWSSSVGDVAGWREAAVSAMTGLPRRAGRQAARPVHWLASIVGRTGRDPGGPRSPAPTHADGPPRR